MQWSAARMCGALAVTIVIIVSTTLDCVAQSEMKPLNADELRKLRIYEAKELARRAVELGQAGKDAEAFPLAEQALQRRELALPSGHPDLSASIVMLGVLHQRLGRYGESEHLLKRGLDMRDRAEPRDPYSIISSLRIIGRFYDFLSRFGEAEPVFRRALELCEAVYKPDDPQIADSLNALAAIYEKQARYIDAERLYKRALALHEQLTVIPLGKGLDGKAGQLRLGRGYLEHADTLSALARIYVAQARFGEAERLFRQVIEMYEKAMPGGDRRIAASLDNLAQSFHAQRRHAEAEALYLRARGMREASKPVDRWGLVDSAYHLGTLYLAQARYDQAEPLLAYALAVRRSSLPAHHLTIAQTMSALGQVHVGQGRLVQAEPLLDSARQMLERALPANHPRIASATGENGFLQLAKGDWRAAFALFQQAISLLQNPQPSGDGAPSILDETRGPLERGDRLVSGLLSAAFQLAETAPGEAEALSQAAFLATQWARHSAAAASLARMATRNARRDSHLAALVRERQDLDVEWEARDKELVAVSSLPADRRNSDNERDLRARLAGIERRVAAIDRALSAGFPEHAALASPRPLGMAEVQALLGLNEVLVVPHHTQISPSDAGATFVWAISRTETRWVRSSSGASALRADVRALRCGLDDAAWNAGDGHCAATFKEFDPKRGAGPLPFDLVRSNRIYSALFGQFEPLIRGKDLLVVPTDVLATLPLQVLLTESPREPQSSAYTEVAWLIRQSAVTVLPTVPSLQSLRSHAKPSTATRPFVGFGNPLLHGPNGNDRSAYGKTDCTPAPLATKLTQRQLKLSRSGVPRDGLANVADVRAQFPLPETADELCAVAVASGATPDSVHLGARATEARVKALSADGTLLQARVVHFATHGLLAAETTVLAATIAEPALILTPPAVASDQDDGLLTTSEITQLKLDADWVVLSACNTASAAEDADHSEALSGLARAFFHAGARALLVSHWAVNSDATVKLITGTFNQLSADRTLGRTEALRRSMLALIDDGGSSAHPSVWAPFVVVGEGAR